MKFSISKEQKAYINHLLNTMTLEEKIGQLHQAAHQGAEVVGPQTDTSNTARDIRKGHVGSVLSVSNKGLLRRLQEIAVEESPKGIPLLFAYDVVHGYQTIFPINLGLAGSFDDDLVKETARVAARECANGGIHMTFAPMLDVTRDPRWGRVMEGFGEDTYLGERVARASVEGFQGADLAHPDAVASCIKHFIGYGLSEGGREYNTVDLSEVVMRNLYLPPFAAAIEAGAASVMTSFNTVEGVPATGNKKLLRSLLKEELGFTGVIISDYNSSIEMTYHKAAKDHKEVAKKCIEAGLDMEMVGGSYLRYLGDLVKEDPELITYIEDSARRVLMLKAALGLFEDPYKGLHEEENQTLLHADHRRVAYEAACKVPVLLENKGVLPLSPSQKVGVIGPFASSQDVNGFWRAIGQSEDAISLASGMKRHQEDLALLDLPHIADDFDKEAIKTFVSQQDVVVLAMGEDQDMSGEGASRAYLDLPGVQGQVIDYVLDLGKPVVLLIFSGRPLVLTPYKEKVDALMQVWFLGSESGNALADLLYGLVSPSAKLPMSFPVALGQVPVYYNQLPTGRPPERDDLPRRFSSRYSDIPNEALYPFGYGLTYSDFSLSGQLVDKNEIKISYTLTNCGQRPASQVVQLYMEPPASEISRPVKQLINYQRITLEAGASYEGTFEVSPDELSYVNQSLKKKVEKGTYGFVVGFDAKDQGVSFQVEVR